MFQSKSLDDQLQKQRREAEEKDAQRRAQKHNLDYLDLISTTVPTEIKAMELIPEEEAGAAQLAPLQIIKKKLVVAVFDPENTETKKIIESLKSAHEVKVVVSSLTGLKHAWDHYQYVTVQKDISGSVNINEARLHELRSEIKSLEDLTKQIQNFKSPYTSQVLEIILSGAMALGASDIHLEPTEKAGDLRLRIDGLLHTIFSEFNTATYHSVITRIKLLSNLKLNVQDEAQDAITAAVEKSLEITFASNPAYGSTGYHFIKWVNKFPGATFQITLTGEEAIKPLMDSLAGADIRRICLKEPTLEDVFISLTGAKVRE